MAFTQQDLDRLDQALASGELSVSQNGRTVTYRSVADLKSARDTVQQELQVQQGKPRARAFRFSNQTLRGM